MDNKKKAGYGADAVNDGPEIGPLVTREQAAANMICYIMHYANQHGGDPATVLRIASMQFSLDTKEAEPSGPQTTDDESDAGWLKWEKPVNASSRILHMRHNCNTKEMDVMFPSDAHYRVSNVTLETYEELHCAASPGGFYHMAIVKNPDTHAVTKLS